VGVDATGVGGIGTRGDGGTDAAGAGGANAMGVRGTGDAGTGREHHCPFTEFAHLGGARC
jgi:hypothetical protein